MSKKGFFPRQSIVMSLLVFLWQRFRGILPSHLLQVVLHHRVYSGIRTQPKCPRRSIRSHAGSSLSRLLHSGLSRHRMIAVFGLSCFLCFESSCFDTITACGRFHFWHFGLSGPVISPGKSFFEVVSATVQGKLMLLVIACVPSFVCAIIQSKF